MKVTHGGEGVKHAKRVGEHEAAHRSAGAERIDELENIVSVVLHAVGPVFKIDIDGDAERVGVGNLFADVFDVLLRCFVELEHAVTLRAFAEEVDDLASAGVNPVQRNVMVHETQHLHAFKAIVAGCPGADVGHSTPLSFADAC